MCQICWQGMVLGIVALHSQHDPKSMLFLDISWSEEPEIVPTFSALFNSK